MLNAYLKLSTVLSLVVFYQRNFADALAISPPSWSNPEVNPCARVSNGWQHLYYAPLKACFKIFTMGFPCNETMELSPLKNGLTGYGECSCPPGTVQINSTSPCYKIYERGPCDESHYVNPLSQEKSIKASRRLGECKKLRACPPGHVYFPEKGGCHEELSQGPCIQGKLLMVDESSIPKCMCSSKGALAKFYHRESKTCHKHFSRGACQPGKLFLPNQTCGCDETMPQYHKPTHQCYALDTSGPCPNHGFSFVVENNEKFASCQCKNEYVKMQDDLCYRLYTRGPCDEGNVVSEERTCITNPCQKNFLYFPHEKTCYRIGSRGPCKKNQVVVFDFNVKVSLDGVSFNGKCGCAGIIKNLDQQCMRDEEDDDDASDSMCESPLVEFKGGCFQLYSRGPCGNGQWLAPSKDHTTSRSVKCQCKPGYAPYDSVENEYGVSGCHSPSVLLARFLNGNKTNYKFGFQKRNWNQVDVVACAYNFAFSWIYYEVLAYILPYFNERY